MKYFENFVNLVIILPKTEFFKLDYFLIKPIKLLEIMLHAQN